MTSEPDSAAPGPSPPADPAAPDGRESLQWSSPELVWPLSIAAGFAGTLLGVHAGFPGAPALIATAAFAPIFVRLEARRRVGRAFLASVAWGVGIVAALVGASVEGDGLAVLEAVPLAAAFAAAQWSGPGSRGFSPGPIARDLGLFLVLLGLARPYLGVLALLLAAYLLDLVGAGVGDHAARAVLGGASPSGAALAGAPPHLVLPLLGALAAVAVVASPGRLRPWSSVGGMRRRLLVGGLAVGVGAIALSPLLGPLWRSTLG